MEKFQAESGSSNILEGRWKQLTGKVREKWGKLTGRDIDVIAGKRDLLVGKLQEHYGRDQKAIEKEVDEFVSSCGDC